MFYDIINTIYAGGIIFILFYIFKIPLSYYIFIILHLFLVFLTNDFLFPINYMPDQFRYIHAAQAIRDTLDITHYYQFDRAGLGNVSNSALFFALFPIPFLNSVFSISIINYVLYSLGFIFFYKKNIFTNYTILFYLFYPSLALYSAIGTRDTLILLIMIISIFFVFKKKYYFSILISGLLIFLKIQNFFIFIFSLILYFLLDFKNLFSLKNIIKYIFILILLLIFLQFFSILDIDKIRFAMYLENGGNLSDYKHISTYLDLITNGFIGGIYMLLKPLPWESRNLLQFAQSIENIVIFYFIYKILIQLKNIKNKFKYFLYTYFIIAMSIYGIVVFNFGTAARYKYTFVVIFIIFGLKLIYDNKGLKYKGSLNEKN